MSQTGYISVILPLKLGWIPSYSVPSGMEDVEMGDRVKVIFSNREYSGVVCATGITPDIDPSRVQPIVSVEHELEKIRPEEIELWKAVSDYYLCDIGEVYKAAYPHGKVNMEEAMASAKSKVRERREKLEDGIRSKIFRLEGRLEKKRLMLEKARKNSAKATYIKEIEKLTEDISLAKASLESIAVRNSDRTASPGLPEIGISLSEAQNRACSEIRKGFAAGRPVLLNGVTGSGKTEIYIRLALEAMSAGKNVLYLVPEIALSRQLEDRLYSYFGERLLVFHSGETAAARRNAAEAVRRDSYIVLGTRSSIFLPHNSLGLIIVDEEHDNSYKQDSPAPRYNGRDSALMMSLIHKCSIILGSATPSLEEVYNCRAGKHVLVELKERFHKGEDSGIEIIDTKAERRKRGMVGNFSRKLADRINDALNNGGQVMILRSRRAWATVMQCGSCGEIVKCPHCNVSLSLHRNEGMLCHYCGHSEQYTGTCVKCGGTLAGLGAGTQRIEEEAEALFPTARIARLDSDTARNKAYEAKTIREFSKGDIDILIGTQMVTKGFDFSGLTLVAVIAADTLLGIQDFRADEKALQLLEQFRGRSGRRNRKGLLVIQTSQPEHPIYQRLFNNETAELNMELLQERKEFNFPPFSRIIEITVRDIFEDRAERMIRKLSSIIRNRFAAGGADLPDSPVAGPYSPIVDKIADNHIRAVRISLKKDRNPASEKEAVRKIVQDFEKENRYEGHITINVDPS